MTMLYDADYDVACDDGVGALLKDLTLHGLALVDFIEHGPAGGNRLITARGTRDAHISWLKWYDDQRAMLNIREDVELRDDELWDAYMTQVPHLFKAVGR